MKESDTISSVEDDDIESDDNDFKEENSDKPKLPPKRAGMTHDTLTLNEGQIVLQMPERLSSESVEDIETWLQLILRKTKRSIASKDDRQKSEEKE